MAEQFKFLLGAESFPVKLMYSEKEISERVYNISSNIAGLAQRVFSNTGQPLIFLGVLSEASLFLADLVKQVGRISNVPIEIQYCKVKSYDLITVKKEAQEVSTDFCGVDVEYYTDRDVLLVDDICDSGETIRLLSKKLSKAASVKTAVLINRYSGKIGHLTDFNAILHGGDEWFVGYGMDWRGMYRNIPAVYALVDNETE